MNNVIDFVKERAKRKSGIHDPKLLEDILDQGFDPADPIELDNYYAWKNFEGQINEELYDSSTWSPEAVERLLNDIRNFEPDDTPYTVTVSLGDIDIDKDITINLKLDEEKG